MTWLLALAAILAAPTVLARTPTRTTSRKGHAMTTHYTDSDVDAARAALRVHVGPDDAHMIDDPECAEDVRVVLDAVTPAITRRAKAEALRDMAFDLEHFETFPGEEPQRLRDRADEIEAGQ